MYLVAECLVDLSELLHGVGGRGAGFPSRTGRGDEARHGAARTSRSGTACRTGERGTATSQTLGRAPASECRRATSGESGAAPAAVSRGAHPVPLQAAGKGAAEQAYVPRERLWGPGIARKPDTQAGRGAGLAKRDTKRDEAGFGLEAGRFGVETGRSGTRRFGRVCGGPHAGQPKVPPAVQSMLERGLVELRTDQPWPRAHFTQAGLDALRELARDRRLLDPVRYAHVLQELGMSTEETGRE